MPSRASRMIGLFGLVLVLGSVPPALGQAGGSRTPDRLLDVADEEASGRSLGRSGFEDILFPALAELEAPPFEVSSLSDLRESMLIVPGDADWAELEAWAYAEAQERAAGQLAEAFDGTRERVLGIGHGMDAADPSWVDAGLFVGLGEGGLLSGARFEYRTRLDEALLLLSVRAASAIASGDGDAGMSSIEQALRLCRAMMDRPFTAEKTWAFERFSLFLERSADLLYEDVARSVDAARLTEFISTLDPMEVGLDRVRLPIGDRLAVEQVVALGFEDTRAGDPDPERLSRVFGEANSASRPLMRFGKVESVRGIAVDHADAYETMQELTGLFGQWQTLWEIEEYATGREVAAEDEYRDLDRRRYAVISRLTPDVGRLIEYRRDLLNSLAGTRAALGILAFERRYGNLPRHVTAPAPAFVDPFERDVYHYSHRRGRHEHFGYFVPVRDEPPAGPRGYDAFTFRVIPDPLPEIEGVSMVDLATRAETDDLTPAERRYLVEYVDSYIEIMRGIATEAFLLALVDQQTRGRRSSIEYLDPESIDQQAIDRAREAVEGAADALNNRRGRNNLIPARQRREMERRGAAATVTDDDREVIRDLATELLERGFPADQNAFVDAHNKIMAWYRDSDRGATFNRIFEFDFPMLEESSLHWVESFLASDPMIAAMEQIEANQPIDDEVVAEIAPTAIDLVFDVRFMRTVVFMAQAYESEWAEWDVFSKSPRWYWTEADFQIARTFQHTIDNRATIETFLLWSAGPDGADDFVQLAGPGGADKLFWPPVLSLERLNADQR